MKGLGFLMVSALLLAACNNVQEKKLIGKWQGASMSEDGMPMMVQPSELGFDFFPNGFYNYRSTLNYKEAGTFSVNGGLLYTMDTINEASSEKAVQILDVTADSLFLKMNADGKVRVVKLFKVK